MRKLISKIIFIVVASFAIIGCKKDLKVDPSTPSSKLLEEVKVYLKNNLNQQDIQSIEWEKSKIPRKVANTNVFFLKQKNAPEESFIIVVQHQGKWMSNFLTILERPSADGSTTSGTIITEPLNRSGKTEYHFLNGKVLNLGDQLISKVSSSVNQKKRNDEGGATLPEVTVRGIRFRTQIYWHSLYWLLGQQPSLLYSYTNDPMRYNPEIQGGSGGDTEAIEPEEDDTASKDSVNIQKMIDCFGNVPDANATYEVKIHADIPVNSNPEALVNLGFNHNVGNPGHVFLRLTKTSGSQQVSQVIGFYPRNGIKSITDPVGNVEGIIVNDGQVNKEHEFNAAFSQLVSASGFQSVIDRILANANRQYSLLTYNCAHFALEAFNEIYPLSSEPQSLLGHRFTAFSLDQSPQGLYKALGAMKDANVPGVEHGVVKKAVTGNGECE